MSLRIDYKLVFKRLISTHSKIVAMFQKIMDTIASTFNKIPPEKGLFVVMTITLLLTQAAIMGIIPTMVGAIAFGIFSGFSIGKIFIEQREDSSNHIRTKTETEVKEKIIPYDSWPDDCYTCGEDIDENMEYRGQFVVHKGESDIKTKAVPLCEECMWTHSTLIDNHDRLVETYDGRVEPEEL